MSERNGPTEGSGWWSPAQIWKTSSSTSSSITTSTTVASTSVITSRLSDTGKNVSVTTINVPQAQDVHDVKNIKYLGGQNGVTVSVVSSCGSPASTLTDHQLPENSSVDDDVEDSDGEVSKIDFRGVNLRTKKKT